MRSAPRSSYKHDDRFALKFSHKDAYSEQSKGSKFCLTRLCPRCAFNFVCLEFNIYTSNLINKNLPLIGSKEYTPRSHDHDIPQHVTTFSRAFYDHDDFSKRHAGS